MLIKYSGFSDLEKLLLKMANDFGVKDTQKNVLVPAAKNAFGIVFNAAKNNLIPGHGYDTGQLKRTLRVNARAVKGKDLRSKYINVGDVVIAYVSAKLNKTYAKNLSKKGKLIGTGDISDARAIAVEFGTAKMPAKPYLRPAIESNYQAVTAKLSSELKKKLESYKAQQTSE